MERSLSVWISIFLDNCTCGNLQIWQVYRRGPWEELYRLGSQTSMDEWFSRKLQSSIFYLTWRKRWDTHYVMPEKTTEWISSLHANKEQQTLHFISQGLITWDKVSRAHINTQRDADVDRVSLVNCCRSHSWLHDCSAHEKRMRGFNNLQIWILIWSQISHV